VHTSRSHSAHRVGPGKDVAILWKDFSIFCLLLVCVFAKFQRNKKTQRANQTAEVGESQLRINLNEICRKKPKKNFNETKKMKKRLMATAAAAAAMRFT